MTKTKLDILKETLLHTNKRHLDFMRGDNAKAKNILYRKKIKTCTDIEKIAVAIRTVDECGTNADTIYMYNRKTDKFVLIWKWTSIYFVPDEEYTFNNFIDLISPGSDFQVTGVSQTEKDGTRFSFLDLRI